jgi:hypothetical protein
MINVDVSSQTPPLVEEEAPFQHIKCLETTKICSWDLRGPDTKIDCPGDGQQQFTGLEWAPKYIACDCMLPGATETLLTSQHK